MDWRQCDYAHLWLRRPLGRESQVRLRSVTTPPATRTMSAGAAPKLSFHVPAAAHTSSYCNKSGSTNTRSCVLWPKGGHAIIGLSNSTVSKCASTNGWRQSSQPWQQFGFANPHDGTWYLKCGDDGGSNIHRRHLLRLLPTPGRHRSVN